MAYINILSFIEKHARYTPDAPAIIMPGRPPLTYAGLHDTVLKTSAYLADQGLRINDRAAVVMPDAVDMAIAFFAVSNIAASVPLNPDFSEDEFKYYISLLKIKFLIVPAGFKDHPSMRAAEGLGLEVVQLDFQEIAQNSVNTPSYPTAGNDDIAIVIYTSGTTARPKVIPNSHINLCAATEYRLDAFRLSKDDRGLIITPMSRAVTLYALLTAVLAGGSAVCTGKFEPAEFSRLLKEYSPTWLSANPAVLQSMADYAEKNNLDLNGSSLRLIRSSGAPLTPVLHERLKRTFKTSIAVTYGMSEAGNVACDYLAPKGRKEGSVGVSSGCEIGIMDDGGSLLPAGAGGEIVVRGPSVMAGYEDDPEANDKSFINGWFRTGDQGYIDEDGYLFITGRIKELINRGGEKVSPYEVEDAILKHPGVLETAVFPVPHARFGEDVAAMVVLKPGAELTLRQLRQFLKGKTSYFKMPTRLYAVKEIPKGPAGKVQRKKLHLLLDDIGADKISSHLSPEEIAAPGNETEEKLIAIWKDILKVERIGVKDNFFDLGGDSLLVAVLFSDIENTWGRKIPLSIIIENGTIEHLAEKIDESSSAAEENGSRPFLVPIQVEGGKTPLFCVHARFGDVLSYWYLSLHLGPDQPVYGLRFNPQGLSGLHPLSAAGLAQRYIADIRSVQPRGPYCLAGYSGGGLIALEIARRLKEEGQEIKLLAMLDSKTRHRKDSLADILKRNRKEITGAAGGGSLAALLGRKAKVKLKKCRQLALSYTYLWLPDSFKPAVARFMDIETLIMLSLRNYRPGLYDGEIVYFLPEEHYRSSSVSLEKWSQLAAGGLRVIKTPGDHRGMIREPHVGSLASELKQCIPGG